MPQAQAQPVVHLRPLKGADLRAVAALDARHTGVAKLGHWQQVLARGRGEGHLAVAAERAGRVVGYLFGEIRAWEFGSPPTGWIYAVGVEPKLKRHGIASSLMAAARHWFGERGVGHLRTMVRRTDVDLLRFFRGTGFVAAPYVELECPVAAPPRQRRAL